MERILCAIVAPLPIDKNFCLAIFISPEIACAALDDDTGIDRLRLIRRVCIIEHFAHIDLIVLTPAPMPFNLITLGLVIRSDFHKR